jgi:hypothetical protein
MLKGIIFLAIIFFFVKGGIELLFDIFFGGKK